MFLGGTSSSPCSSFVEHVPEPPSPLDCFHLEHDHSSIITYHYFPVRKHTLLCFTCFASCQCSSALSETGEDFCCVFGAQSRCQLCLYLYITKKPREQLSAVTSPNWRWVFGLGHCPLGERVVPSPSSLITLARLPPPETLQCFLLEAHVCFSNPRRRC